MVPLMTMSVETGSAPVLGSYSSEMVDVPWPGVWLPVPGVWLPVPGVWVPVPEPVPEPEPVPQPVPGV